ncbi:nicotinate phosphoribosyltransferase [Spiroplasma corruscae]|uniref:nicotinate phosphoribosyltransferase n=1 Tax=Spiroplasma corruscae TaxID=216934 RepID=A0A222EN28_9MOLU|nr:nicotinate phosphoribosyltransferase [Spiroplasma corruscae]ASP27919.1 nicotinate phosphoribosyltransferase [Spiroplasma corruscae]
MRNNLIKPNFYIDKRVYDDYYIADYFVKTRKIIQKFHPDTIFTMQWFQRNDGVFFCGSEIIKDLLVKSGVKNIIVDYLEEGSIINSNEPVLRITGKYESFCHLEGLIDGILSRATTVANNAYHIKIAANNKMIINMNDRMDLYLNQQIDGYASYTAGLINLVTPASFEYINIECNLQGTMPHSLIAAFDGDIIAASKAYNQTYPNNKLVVLVDYNNDVITDSIKVCKAMNGKVWAVRIDTSANLIDNSLQKLGKTTNEYKGVNVELVNLLRDELDKNGYNDVKIIVSSGFNIKKIELFENNNSKVDIYGVGEALTINKISFTGDVVKINGKDQSKFGRKYMESFRLKSIKY